MSDCPNTEAMLDALVDGSTDVDEELEAHVSDCAECRRSLVHAFEFERALAELAAQEHGERLRARIHAELSPVSSADADADRTRPSRPGRRQRRRSSRRYRRPSRPWGIVLAVSSLAAAVLLAFAPPRREPVAPERTVRPESAVADALPEVSASFVRMYAGARLEQLEPAGWMLLGLGARLGTGDVVRHGGAGSAEIHLADGSVLRLEQEAEMTFGRGPGAVVLTLTRGALEADIRPQPPGRQLRVATPHGTAFVIGTRFRLEVVDDACRVEVTEGTVELSNKNEERVSVSSGFRALSRAGSPPVALPLAPALGVEDRYRRLSVRWRKSGVPGGAHCATFSPTGEFIALGTGNGVVVVCEAGSGKVVERYPGLDEMPAHVVVWYPDEGRLAVSSENGTVRVIRRGARVHARPLTGHQKGANGLALSPDGRTLASASWDQTVRVWSAESGRAHGVLRGHGSGIAAVAFFPNGARLLTGCNDGTIGVWDVASRKLLVIHRAHAEPVGAVGVFANGRRAISVSADRSVRAWRLSTADEVWSADCAADPLSVTVAPDQSACAVGDDGGSVRVLSLRDGEPLYAARLHRRGVPALGFSPDGSALATGSWDGSLTLLSLPPEGNPKGSR